MVGERSILHLNVADFAVAVERTADPGLRGRPVVVAPPGSPRARVYDMSEEAFRAGVRKGMPLARALRLCRYARLLPPRPGLYRRAMAALARRALRYTPLVEAEEASGHLYLDLTGTGRLWGPPRDVARRLYREVRTELGLDPIWTLAANKLVAKAASRLVKPLGELLVPPPDAGRGANLADCAPGRT
jgi:DNA polymerase-4